MNTIRRCVITTAYALAWLGLALLVLREFVPSVAHQETPLARCPNYDRIAVHSRHWDQTQRPAKPLRVIPAPPCEDPDAR